MLVKLLGSFLGAGLSPIAPGTAGSIATAVVIYLLAAGPLGEVAWWGWVLVALVLSAAGIWLGNLAESKHGKDPQWFVLDESAGVCVAFIGQLELAPDQPAWLVVTVCLLFFRGFDILKPWPVGRLEALPGGTGIMLDDVAAGVLAWPCAFGVLYAVGKMAA